MASGVDTMKENLLKVPYLKELLLSKELAEMAFDYMAKRASMSTKKDFGAAYSEVRGRMEAWSAGLKDFWSGRTGLAEVIDDYLDYVSLNNPAGPPDDVLDLREYFDATRAHNDRGNYENYAKVMKMMDMEN